MGNAFVSIDFFVCFCCCFFSVGKLYSYITLIEWNYTVYCKLLHLNLWNSFNKKSKEERNNIKTETIIILNNVADFFQCCIISIMK